jgi:CHASE3 domain sensor protein
MEDPYEAQRRAIADLQARLALLPPDDPQRAALYRELHQSYREAFALISEQVEAQLANGHVF